MSAELGVVTDPLAGVAALRAGACGWVARNAAQLDSPAGRAQLPAVPRAKALLQLAGLVRGWAHVRPGDPELAEPAALVRRVWARDELPAAFAAEPRDARQYGLMYCALAPGGPRRAMRARIEAEGWLMRPVRSPYLRLEIAHFAGLAGLDHRCGARPEVDAACLLARPPRSEAELCVVAHVIFYLTDYGLRAPALPEQELASARRLVDELTRRCVAREGWDDVAKFVLAQHCLGLAPAATPSGAAALRELACVQDASGAIPCAAARLAPTRSATPVERFRKAYQTTVMTALAAVMVSSAAPT